jgi:hypothetical protein
VVVRLAAGRILRQTAAVAVVEVRLLRRWMRLYKTQRMRMQ